MAIQTFVADTILTAAQMNALQGNDYNQTVSTKTASYTLVAADKGTRITMNSASATTITVNTSLFSAGDTLFIQNIGAGTCTVTAGTATVSTSGSLALAQYGGGTLYFTSAGVATFFSGGAATAAFGVATGGTSSSITLYKDTYTLLTFTSDSNLTVTTAGVFDVLLIGGGGGAGGGAASVESSGAGGGGPNMTSMFLQIGTYAVDVGAGGAGGATTVNGTVGATSSIAPLIATAPGGGFGVSRAGGPNGGNGACLLYTSPSPRDRQKSRMPSSA